MPTTPIKDADGSPRDVLTELLATLPSTPPPPAPPPVPRDGQSRQEWLAEVASCRALHDAQAAAAPQQIDGSQAPVSSVTAATIPVDDGEIAARVYRPVGTGPFPAVVNFHGGGWWMGGGETGFALTDGQCRRFCAGLNAVMVNVDYRLAPEYAYPFQLDDCYRAVAWVAEQGDLLSIDPQNISVMGGSSGGNEAAAVCLLARERGGPAIRCQILLLPALDLTGSSPSIREVPGLSEQLQSVVTLYAPPEIRTDALVSPLFAEDLSGLPPTVIVTGDFDPLRDDGRRYAERLEADGVPVAWRQYPMMHGVALPETNAQMVAETLAAIGEWITPR